MNICDATDSADQKLVTLKTRMYAPVSTTLANNASLNHHCPAFEILAIQLTHSPRWTILLRDNFHCRIIALQAVRSQLS